MAARSIISARLCTDRYRINPGPPLSISFQTLSLLTAMVVMEAQKLHISVCSVPIASVLHPTQKPIAPFTGHFSTIKFNLWLQRPLYPLPSNCNSANHKTPWMTRYHHHHHHHHHHYHHYYHDHHHSSSSSKAHLAAVPELVMWTTRYPAQLSESKCTLDSVWYCYSTLDRVWSIREKLELTSFSYCENIASLGIRWMLSWDTLVKDLPG